jgi:hypothetical protein
MPVFDAGEVEAMVETVNELSNAVLLQIASPGPLAGNGDPGTPVPAWEGEARGALERTQKESTQGDRERQGKSVTFHVYDAIAPADELAGANWGATTVVIRDESYPTPKTSRWTVNGLSKETEGTLDGVTLELIGETTP